MPLEPSIADAAKPMPRSHDAARSSTRSVAARSSTHSRTVPIKRMGVIVTVRRHVISTRCVIVIRNRTDARYVITSLSTRKCSERAVGAHARPSTYSNRLAISITDVSTHRESTRGRESLRAASLQFEAADGSRSKRFVLIVPLDHRRIIPSYRYQQSNALSFKIAYCRLEIIRRA